MIWKMDDIPKEKIIEDFESIPYLLHKQKSTLLKLLMNKEMTIIDLKGKTKINPGTIRRYLDDFIEKDLVYLVRTEKTNFGQKMKFYRATAKKFLVRINFDWPINDEN